MSNKFTQHKPAFESEDSEDRLDEDLEDDDFSEASYSLDEVDDEDLSDFYDPEDEPESEVDDDSVELEEIEDFNELEWLDPDTEMQKSFVCYPSFDEPVSLEYGPLSDELEGFEPDEFDESAHRRQFARVDIAHGLTRRERAEQVAMEVAGKYGWEEDGVRALTDAFLRHGWSATKTALERQMERGLTADELRIAMDIRELWQQNSFFGMSFQYVGTNTDWSSHSHHFWIMSWPCALSLIRSFGACPDLEEVEQFLFELHERWKSNPGLRYCFAYFYDFVRFYTDRLCEMDEIQPGMWLLDELASR